MEWMEIFKLLGIIGVPIAIAVTGYVVGAMKSLDNANKNTAKNLNDFKLEIAKQYVPRDELGAAITTLRAEMKSTEDRLEKRFDKMEQWMGRRFDMLLGRVTPEI